MSCQHYFCPASQFQRKARCSNSFINAGIRNSPARLSTPPNTTNSGFKALISEAMPIPRSRPIFSNAPSATASPAAPLVDDHGYRHLVDTTVCQLEQLSRLSLLESFFGYDGTVPAGLLRFVPAAPKLPQLQSSPSGSTRHVAKFGAQRLLHR